VAGRLSTAFMERFATEKEKEKDAAARRAASA
jgi:hypothetical protein